MAPTAREMACGAPMTVSTAADTRPINSCGVAQGGVDDAEDAEAIVHEYGHAVQDAQVPGFGSSLEAGSIGEAFGDYLAVTVGLHEAKVNGWPVRTDPACVADWDSVSYTLAPHCLRTLSENKHYPEDLQGEVHADGEIWSQALW